jgi:integrase
MPHIKITNSSVTKIISPISNNTDKSSQVFYRDTILQGFGLRITSNGAKSYFIEKRINGKNKRITIGKHGQITPEQARKQAQALLGSIALGQDPVLEKQIKQIKTTTLRQAFEAYLQTRKKLNPGTIQDYKRAIQESLDSWLEKPLTSITKDMVENKHLELGKKSPARANNTMRVLRAIFNFSIEQYESPDGKPLIQLNPVNRLSKTKAWYNIEKRRTLLTPDQLKPWYDATLLLNQIGTRDYLHFLLFTGLRRTEAASLKWKDINFNEKFFVIPDTKNSEPHYLPIPTFLENLLNTRKLSSESEWVFPSPISNGPLKEPKNAIKKVIEKSGIIFQLHDLRRTFITIAESIDIPAYALKRLLNHKSANDITAGYIVPSIERLREPMQKVTDYIVEKIKL